MTEKQQQKAEGETLSNRKWISWKELMTRAERRKKGLFFKVSIKKCLYLCTAGGGEVLIVTVITTPV